MAATALLAAGIALPPAALGFAGYQPGPYAGRTEQGQEIRFRAGEWRVKRLNTVLNADCKNGTRQRIEVTDGGTGIEDDRFELQRTGEADLVVRITGRISDDQASGRIEATVRPGKTVCTADLRWQAKRV
jgi:hypothetical protein